MRIPSPYDVAAAVTAGLPDGAVKDALARLANVVHRTAFDLTDGRLGGSIVGMTAVKLVTTGRRSGERRPTMLTAPIVEDDRIVLVASHGGDVRHPYWYRNIESDPEVEVVVRGRRRRMRARTAVGAERAELWPRIVAAYAGYARYQEKTDREIPVVICEPAA